MYELFEHTADLGLRVVADDLESLFEEAAVGLFSILVSGPLEATQLEEEFRLEGERKDFLLVDWLSELLYTFESRQLIFSEFRVVFDSGGLHAKARGQRRDPVNHRVLHEVKAITYHGLKLESTEKGWLSEIIVDL